MQVRAGNVKLAIVGCGRIAQVIHLRAMARLRGADLVAIADTDAGRLAAAGRLATGATTFTDFRELIRRSDADGIIVTLPPALHAEAAIAALDAGKHVYLEKPIAEDISGARAILQAQLRNGRLGMIGFNFRFHPLYLALREQIRRGRVGRVVGVRTTFGAAARDLPPWKTARNTGGGALLDLASHHVDLMRFLFDSEVREVFATIRSVRSEHDTALLQMRLDDDTETQTFVSMTAAEDDRIEVLGDAGMLAADRYRARGLRFQPSVRRLARPHRLLDAVRATIATPARVLDVLTPPQDPSHRNALQAFVDAIRHGDESPVPLRHGLQSLAVVLAAEESARLGRSVSIQAPTRRGGGDRAARPPAEQAERSPNTLRTLSASERDAGSAGNEIAMSVVLVGTDGFRCVRRTVRHLRDQSVASRLELILVGPDHDSLGDFDAGEVSGFAAVRSLAVGRITNIDVAAVPGIRCATAGIVALVEDHAYPEPGWAEALLRAHEGPWAAVGSTMVNANPASALSWTNLLIAYGAWIDPVPGGETRSVPLHNISFKREVLREFDADLERLLGRAGGFLHHLLERGHRLFVAADARIQHANPSLLSSTVALRLNAGRVYGASRASTEGWSGARRLLYIAGSPLIPLVRALPLRDKLAVTGLGPRVYPALALGLLLDGLGQALGYSIGAGDKADRLADFEFDRLRHLTARDRAALEN